MKLRIIIGDIADAKAEAICTSTNPRLSLAMGTGGAIVERGGWSVRRECEALLESAGRDAMPVGSVHATGAGLLSAKIILHCVASNSAHKSSEAVIEACVENALALAVSRGCHTIAMPVFGSGHAHFPFDRAVEAMTAAISNASHPPDQIILVVSDAELATQALALVRVHVPDAELS